MIRFLVTLLTFVSFLSASTVEKFADEVIQSLQLAPGASLSVTVLEQDRKYMLTLAPAIDELRDILREKGLKVSFKSADGAATAVLYKLLEEDTGLQPDESMLGENTDTLILSGAYQVNSSEKVFCTFQLTSINKETLSEETIQLDKASASPAYQSKLFSEIDNEKKLQDIQTTGNMIATIDKFFYSAGNRVLIPNEAYRIVDQFPHALGGQKTIFKTILTSKYGITESHTAKGKILLSNGAAILSYNNEKGTIANVIQGAPLFGDIFTESMKNIEVANLNPFTEAVEFESIPYKEEKLITIRDAIVNTFEVEYPKLFHPYNIQKLKEVFRGGDEQRILIGNVLESNAETGVEQVAYSYLTRDQWLAGLTKLHKAGRRFHLKTSVVDIISDNEFENRYFAVVKQSFDAKQGGVVAYHDDGFLIVSFDYDFENNKARSYEILQRFWFYDYKYNDREKNVTRVGKIEKDLKEQFVSRPITGVTKILKNKISDVIINEADKLR